MKILELDGISVKFNEVLLKSDAKEVIFNIEYYDDIYFDDLISVDLLTINLEDVGLSWMFAVKSVSNEHYVNHMKEFGAVIQGIHQKILPFLKKHIKNIDSEHVFIDHFSRVYKGMNN